MRSAPLPYILEDRTGVYNASDFDDIYDRLFLRIAESSHDAESSVSMIYDMGKRSSRRPDSRHFDRQPTVVLDFGPNGALGSVHFMQPPASCSLPMYQYLRKTTIFGGCVMTSILRLPQLTSRVFQFVVATVQRFGWTRIPVESPECRRTGVDGEWTSLNYANDGVHGCSVCHE